MSFYQIEVKTPNGWSNDATLLGHGLSQADNCWATKGDAFTAMFDLEAAGFNPYSLRVAPAPSQTQP